MNSTTLSFANIHNHGELFENVFRARRDCYTIRHRWDLPEIMQSDYDQYDTPQSRWLAIHDDSGRVLAGARLTPTNAKCGMYSYMLRDAQRGLLDQIPEDVLFDEAPILETTWEVTRGFVVHDIPAEERHMVRMSLVRQMMQASRDEGISRMLALLPSNWRRWAARCQLRMEAAGKVLEIDGKAFQAVWIDFSTQLN